MTDAEAGSSRLNQIDSLHGLRGVAAMAVVLVHYSVSTQRLFPPNALLAVDFFFILSGYVIARTYEQRLLANRAFRGEFFIKRLRRLYPLAFLGALLGALAAWVTSEPATVLKAWPNLLLLPTPFNAGGGSFPLNTPLWSLFCELAVNAVYAVTVTRLRTPVLVALTMASCLVFLGTLLQLQRLPIIERDIIALGNVTARTVGGFSLGVLLWRMNDVRPPITCNVVWLWAALLATFIIDLPYPYKAAYLSVCVYGIYPVIVWIACHSDEKSRIAVALGIMSYPLYTIHFPLVRLWEHWIGAGRYEYAAPFLAALVGLAYLIGHLVDDPARKRRQRVAAKSSVPAGQVGWQGTQ